MTIPRNCKLRQSTSRKKGVIGNWARVQTNIAKKFGKSRDSLSIVEEILMFDDRVIVPTKLREHIVGTLHHGHPGMRRIKQLAREYVYWHGMTEHIEKLTL